MTPQISRKQAWCKLAILIADGLPDVEAINFHSEIPHVDIRTDSAGDLHVWAKHLGLRANTPHEYSGPGGGWIHTADGGWLGYRVTVRTLEPNAEPEPVDDDMAAVRAVANEASRAGDSDAAPEASAIATTQPGDTNLPRGGEEVAGPVEGTGSATSPEWTPGAGLERLKREMPHIVADLTDDDMRKADEVIAAAWPIALVVEWEG